MNIAAVQSYVVGKGRNDLKHRHPLRWNQKQIISEVATSEYRLAARSAVYIKHISGVGRKAQYAFRLIGFS